MTSAVKDKIRAAVLAAGFDAVGFAPATLGAAVKHRLQEFLAKGYHGEMAWLEARAEERASPNALWPAAKSVICLGMNYGPEHDPRAVLAQTSAGAISVYAQHKDYHDVLKKKQRALASWIASEFGCEVKIFVDTAPVMEKPLAQLAGVGWQGKHTNLVSRTHGSWLFLAEIFTTLDLVPDKAETDHCGACTRCLDVCPTQAFVAPYQLDATKCIAYLTIEHKSAVPEKLRPLLGNRVYGCDDCLAVCPWNKFATPTAHEPLQGKKDLQAPALAELAMLDDAAFRQKFSGRPIKRIGRDRFVRNVLYAIGNSRDQELLPVAEHLQHDDNDVVRDAAAWAASRLNNL